MRRTCAALLILGCFATHPVAGADQPFSLTLRSRVEGPKDSGAFRVVEKPATWDPAHTAIIVCDMWDLHHCLNAVRREGEMAPRMDQVLKAARDRGTLIIHAPSGCTKTYDSNPARSRARAVPRSTESPGRHRQLVLQDPERGEGNLSHRPDRRRRGRRPRRARSMGGEADVDGQEPARPWTSQTDKLTIDADRDMISDDGNEIWSILESRGINNVILMGVHTNMCVLGRPFGLRQMAKNGKAVVLMRDMTDTMYNPARAPFVSHFSGSDLIFEHIEKFVCPTITSDQIIGGKPFRFNDDHRPLVTFLLSEDEYKTERTLPAFAARNLAKDFRLRYVFSAEGKPNDLEDLGALEDSDLAVVSMRRRVLPKAQVDAIRRFVASGKPVIGLRTASHAFSPRGNDAVPGDRAAWPGFDAEVLGGNYQGHHNNGGITSVAASTNASSHPILSGIDARKLVGHGSLYKVNPLAASATPLLVGTIPAQPSEPVAWTNLTTSGGRVFYTSLGHPDDFRDPEFNQLLRNAAYWATKLDVPSSPAAASEPAASTGLVTPNDLRVEQVLAEPIVRQPVFLNFDERGRMWVVQYLQYPDPAGLKMLSRDGVWRAVYDKTPAAPPHHVRGADKITIHEDTDGDGTFDRHKTFVDGLNIATAVVKGRGGAWVLNPPYLLFYPDKDNDDVPDGDPVVHLEGFGLEDTHSVVNSLRWGPDGWLYAAQGSTVTARVRRPGSADAPVASMGQLIWRYHPETRRYEVFAEGGGNAFGVEIDSKGRIYSGHNGGDTRGFHYVQGGYFQKGFSKHGPLSNPYAFGYFPAMKHDKVPRFTHNFVIYDGDSLPEHYRGNLFGVDPLNHVVVISEVASDGSTFRTKDIGQAIKATDQAFRPVDIKLGPDGALYVADWHDRQVNHYRNHEGQIDKDDGRIYRLGAKGTNSARTEDLSKRSTDGLIALLAHPNQWHRQTALRLLGDRKDPSAVPKLVKMVREGKGQIALEALWALNLSGGFDDAAAREFLSHEDPYVRLWAVRLACDDHAVSSEIARAIADRAGVEPDLEVRSQMACSARRLAAGPCLAIVRNLLVHGEDAQDLHMPLLIWWAIESKCATDRQAILAFLRDRSAWDLPIIKSHVIERLMRRYAGEGGRANLQTCSELLRLSPGQDATRRLVSGLEMAFAGQPLPDLPDDLADAMARFAGNSIPIALRRGRPDALKEALAILSDERADRGRQMQIVQILGEVDQPSCVPTLLKIACESTDPALRSAAMAALSRYDAPEIGAKILGSIAGTSDDLRADAISLLAGRASWSLPLLRSVDANQVDPGTFPPVAIQTLRLHRDPQIVSLVRKHWGEPKGAASAEHRARIEQISGLIQEGSGVPKPGKAIFAQRCAKCHTLFGQGGKVGPDLTSYRRDDLPTMLLSIVSPSAEIREGFASHLIATTDGRTLLGTLIDQDARRVLLRSGEGRDVSIPRRDRGDGIEADLAHARRAPG